MIGTAQLGFEVEQGKRYARFPKFNAIKFGKTCIKFNFCPLILLLSAPTRCSRFFGGNVHEKISNFLARPAMFLFD